MRNHFALLVAGAAIASGCSNPTTADILSSGDEIKYLVDKDQPPAGWSAAAYDDSQWQRALGAIGEFFEAGVDLNQLFNAATNNLPSFSSFVIETRSSASTNTIRCWAWK